MRKFVFALCAICSSVVFSKDYRCETAFGYAGYINAVNCTRIKDGVVGYFYPATAVVYVSIFTTAQDHNSGKVNISTPSIVNNDLGYLVSHIDSLVIPVIHEYMVEYMNNDPNTVEYNVGTLLFQINSQKFYKDDLFLEKIED
jgi:hypothetical protein